MDPKDKKEERKYIEYLMELEESKMTEQYMEHLLERDRLEYNKMVNDSNYMYIPNLIQLQEAVDRVYAGRFDEDKVKRHMDGFETPFQKFLRLHHGLTPVYGGMEDFMDDEIILIGEDEDHCDNCPEGECEEGEGISYKMPYRKAVK